MRRRAMAPPIEFNDASSPTRRRSMTPPIEFNDASSPTSSTEDCSPGHDLPELILSWIKEKEHCAELLKKQAQELESHRKNSNISETVGSTTSVLGAAGLIGAGVATVLTGGAFAGVLGLIAAVTSGLGASVSLGTKITEHCLTNNIMKEAKETEKRSNEIEKKIQQQLEEIMGSLEEPVEVDQCFVNEFVTAFTRRSRSFNPNQSCNPAINATDAAVTAAVIGILTLFVLEFRQEIKPLITKGHQQLIKAIPAIAMKAALKGGVMIVGGAVGMAFALPEVVENCKDLIRKNHVTKASQSLRDTADKILKSTQELKKLLNRIKMETSKQ